MAVFPLTPLIAIEKQICLLVTISLIHVSAMSFLISDAVGTVDEFWIG